MPTDFHLTDDGILTYLKGERTFSTFIVCVFRLEPWKNGKKNLFESQYVESVIIIIEFRLIELSDFSNWKSNSEFDSCAYKLNGSGGRL